MKINPQKISQTFVRHTHVKNFTSPGCIGIARIFAVGVHCIVTSYSDDLFLINRPAPSPPSKKIECSPSGCALTTYP